MPRRPAVTTQADMNRALRAAKQAGVNEVEVRVGQASFVFRIAPTDPEKPVAEPSEIVL